MSDWAIVAKCLKDAAPQPERSGRSQVEEQYEADWPTAPPLNLPSYLPSLTDAMREQNTKLRDLTNLISAPASPAELLATAPPAAESASRCMEACPPDPTAQVAVPAERLNSFVRFVNFAAGKSPGRRTHVLTQRIPGEG